MTWAQRPPGSCSPYEPALISAISSSRSRPYAPFPPWKKQNESGRRDACSAGPRSVARHTEIARARRLLPGRPPADAPPNLRGAPAQIGDWSPPQSNGCRVTSPVISSSQCPPLHHPVQESHCLLPFFLHQVQRQLDEHEGVPYITLAGVDATRTLWLQ
jgi:hypothetical protein